MIERSGREQALHHGRVVVGVGDRVVDGAALFEEGCAPFVAQYSIYLGL